MSWIARTAGSRRLRSAAASRCGSRMSSIATSALERSRYAALRSASPGNISGSVRPAFFSHVLPILAMRSRIRTSGCALRAYSRAAQPAPSGSAGSGAHPIALAGARPSSSRQSAASGRIQIRRFGPRLPEVSPACVHPAAR